MLKNDISLLKSNLVWRTFTAALIIYNNDDIINDSNFLNFIDEIMKNEQVDHPLARMLIIEKECEFIINKQFLIDIYDHKFDNRLVIFKGKNLIKDISLEEIKKTYLNN